MQLQAYSLFIKQPTIFFYYLLLLMSSFFIKGVLVGFFPYSYTILGLRTEGVTVVQIVKFTFDLIWCYFNDDMIS